MADVPGKVGRPPEHVNSHYRCHLSVVPNLNFHASVPCNSVAAVVMMLVALAGKPVERHSGPEVICPPNFLSLIGWALTVDLVDFAVQLRRQLHYYSLDSKKRGTVYVSMNRLPVQQRDGNFFRNQFVVQVDINICIVQFGWMRNGSLMEDVYGELITSCPQVVYTFQFQI